MSAPLSLIESLAQVPDPRDPRGIHHAGVGTCVADAWEFLNEGERSTIVGLVDAGIGRAPATARLEKRSDRLKSPA